MRSQHLPAGDNTLVQIVDAALADITRRSGNWLVCRPGCTQCCIGVFAISQLDAERLRHGLAELQHKDQNRADAIRQRAQEAVKRLSPAFPGNPHTGILGSEEEAEALFEDFANDEPCPVLDTASGRCELYESRPITCRAFGPPVRSEDGLGICELCFHGATDEQIAACEMKVDPDDLESGLLMEIEDAGGPRGRTVIAFALRD